MKHIERSFLFKGVIAGAIIAAIASIVAIFTLQPKNIIPESFLYSGKSSTNFDLKTTQTSVPHDKTTIDGESFIVLKTIVSSEGLYARVLSIDDQNRDCYSSDDYLSIWDKQGERLLQKRQLNAVLIDDTKCIKSVIWSDSRSISFSDNEGVGYLYQIDTDQFVSI